MLTSIAWSHVVCDNISLLTFILTLNILILIPPIKYGIYSTGILKQKSLVHHVSSNLYYFLAMFPQNFIAKMHLTTIA